MQLRNFGCELDLFCNFQCKYWRTNLSFIVPLVSGTTMQIALTKLAEQHILYIYVPYNLSEYYNGHSADTLRTVLFTEISLHASCH